MKKVIHLVTLLAFVLAAGGVLAEDIDLIKLEKHMWGLAKDKKWDELKERYAPKYLMVDEHGVSDLKSTMEALRKMNLHVFSLTDFKAVRTGNTTVLTYKASVAETIGGKRVQKQKAPRASVWVKTDKGWRTVLHANFNPLAK